MTKTYPKIEFPTIPDIEAATEHLYPDAPRFAEPGFRLWTDAERKAINDLAYQIMLRRKTKH